MIYQETDNKNYIDDVSVIAIGTLRSDNGDANKNVAKKIECVSFQTFSRFFQVVQLRQSRETMSEREGEREGGGGEGRIRVQTKIVKLIALQFPSSSTLKIWSIHVVVVKGQKRNVQKIVMDVQRCCFANFGYVNMIPNSFGAATRIIQNTASFHTQ